MPHPPSVPVERFATMIAWLGNAVAAMGGGDRLGNLLICQIIERLRVIKQRFVGLAARIQAGRYKFRVVTAPHRGAAKPRPADPLPKKFGWLLPMVPDAVCYRSQFEWLLRDAEMVALVQAAPASMRRPLRSLCHILGLRPPEILALPKKPRPPPKPKTPAAAPEPPPEPRVPPPELPEWIRRMRRSLPQFARPLPPPRAPKNRA